MTDEISDIARDVGTARATRSKDARSDDNTKQTDIAPPGEREREKKRGTDRWRCEHVFALAVSLAILRVSTIYQSIRANRRGDLPKYSFAYLLLRINIIIINNMANNET